MVNGGFVCHHLKLFGKLALCFVRGWRCSGHLHDFNARQMNGIDPMIGAFQCLKVEGVLGINPPAIKSYVEKTRPRVAQHNSHIVLQSVVATDSSEAREGHTTAPPPDCLWAVPLLRIRVFRWSANSVSRLCPFTRKTFAEQRPISMGVFYRVTLIKVRANRGARLREFASSGRRPR
jgi:hypothetical protein